jgi:TPR repeat protein
MRSRRPSLPALVLTIPALVMSHATFADLDISALIKQRRPQTPTPPGIPAVQPPPAALTSPATSRLYTAATPRVDAAELNFRDAVSLDTPGASRQTLIRASDLYRKAAELGHVKAQLALALMFAQGHGVASDDKRAAFWLTKAAASGNAIAQYSLGLLYYEGRGIKRDYDRALSLYRDAAANGNAKAMNNLGIMHALGHGVSESNIEALTWFTLAAQAGSEDAPVNAQLLEHELSKTELATASKRATLLRAQLGQ